MAAPLRTSADARWTVSVDPQYIVSELQTIAVDAVHIDALAQHGQIRCLDPRHVLQLKLEFTQNPPTKLLEILAVQRDATGTVFMRAGARTYMLCFIQG